MARVAVVALDGEVLEVAGAAEDLHGLAGCRSFAVRDASSFAVAALASVRAALVLQPRGAEDAEFRGVDARRLMSAILNWIASNLGDRPAELLALLRVLDRRVGARRGRWPTACDAMPIRPPSSVSIAIGKALADLAEHVALRHAAAVEHEFARGGRADAELLLLLADAEARKRPLDEETRHAMRLLWRPARLRANTMKKSACVADVTQSFVPSSTNASPSSRRAEQTSAAASLPEPASESEYAPSHSPLASFGR